MSAPSVTPQIEKAVAIVQESFVHEFSPQEIKWPYLFGGWWPTYINGLDASIAWRAEHSDALSDCAYWACRTRWRISRKLQCKASMAYSRRKNMTLVEVPDRPSDWLALQPLFGTKKTMKDYFGMLARAPREIKRKYVQLYLMRRAKFNSFLTGKEDCPSVPLGWLRRHPNSVIIKGMEGVKYSSEGFVVGKPIVGITLDNTESKLYAMQLQGFLTCDVLKKDV